MYRKNATRIAALAAGCGLTAAILAPHLRAVPRSGQEQGAAAPAMTMFALSARPPKGAVVLIGGKAEDMAANWYKRRSLEPATWTVDATGVATPQKVDITSKQEFGDQLRSRRISRHVG